MPVEKQNIGVLLRIIDSAIQLGSRFNLPDQNWAWPEFDGAPARHGLGSNKIEILKLIPNCEEKGKVLLRIIDSAIQLGSRFNLPDQNWAWPEFDGAPARHGLGSNNIEILKLIPNCEEKGKLVGDQLSHKQMNHAGVQKLTFISLRKLVGDQFS